MSTLAAKTVRIACDITSEVPVGDLLTGRRVIIWRGAAAAIQASLFNGVPGPTTFITDTSNIVSAELIVRKHNAGGAILLDKLLPDSAVINSTYAAWIAGTGQQMVFDLEEAYTSWPVLDSGTLPIWFAIYIVTTTTSYIAAQGYGQIVDVGIVDVVAPALPTGFLDLVVNANGNTDVIVTRNTSVIRVHALAMPTAYTYTLVLFDTNAIAGGLIDLEVILDASANINFKVYFNAKTPLALIHSVSGDLSNVINERVVFRYDGNAWVKFGPETS